MFWQSRKKLNRRFRRWGRKIFSREKAQKAQKLREAFFTTDFDGGPKWFGKAARSETADF
jgi:hypothetical protein